MSPRDPRLDIEGLYRTHRAEVYRVALRKLGDHHEAEDVTQTAFLDAYRAMLRGSHPELPRAWLLAIAENVRRRRYRPAVTSLREEPLRDEFAALDSEAQDLAERIRAALGELATTQRHAFLLRELGGLSYGEIAARLEISVPAVQMLLFRARQKLRIELGATRGLGALLGPHAIVGLVSRLATGGAGAPKVAVAVAAVAGGVGSVGLKATAPAPQAAPVEAPAAAPAEPRPVRDQAPLRPVARAKPAPVQAPTRRVSRPAPAAHAEPAPVPPAPVAPPPRANGAEPVVRVVPSTTPGSDDEAPAPLLAPTVTSGIEVPIVSAAVPVQPSLPSAPVEAVPVPPDVVIVPPLPQPTDVAEELIPEEVGSSLAPG